jgi:hypothetical protein
MGHQNAFSDGFSTCGAVIYGCNSGLAEVTTALFERFGYIHNILCAGISRFGVADGGKMAGNCGRSGTGDTDNGGR